MSGTAITIKDWRKDIPGELNPERTIFMFPKIMSKNSRGAQTEWRILVSLKSAGANIEIKDEYFNNKPMDANINAVIRVESGVVGGKTRDVVPTVIAAGKNLGRANATNVLCQALRDALGMHNKQLRKSTTGEVNNQPNANQVEKYPPMLAQRFQDQVNFDWNAPKYVQYKYNGVRCVSTFERNDEGGRVIMYSRRKLAYPGFQYIKNELLPVLKQYWDADTKLYLDGEMYQHGMALQNISGYARTADKPDDIRIDYMIYDCFIPSQPMLIYSARYAILQEIFKNYPDLKFVKLAETALVTKDTYEAKYKEALGLGYEGVMIRHDLPYMYSYNEHHSNRLLKYKPTLDAEYPIVGWETGTKGKASEALMIVCSMPNNPAVKFPVTPAMELPERITLAKKMTIIEENGKTHFENNYLGKMLIVYFDEKSVDGLPQRARTKMEIRTWD